MDSGALLDLLGNENRRRILRLLSRKPCYVTEISEYLGVSSKAVIDHLRRLEEAGLVESETDERRRKYFRIARNVRLEVNLSPYGFGTKSAYPASRSLDLGRCSHLSVDVRVGAREGRDATGAAGEGEDDPAAVAEDVADLRALERELSLAQRWVQGRIAERRAALGDALPAEEDRERVYADVLVAVAREPRSTEALARSVEAPPDLVRGALSVLADRGLVERTAEGWRVTPRE